MEVRINEDPTKIEFISFGNAKIKTINFQKFGIF